MSTLRLPAYARLFRAGIKRQSTYRLALLGGLVANATFGFLKPAILLATVHAAGGSLGGYDVATMSGYVWISQGLLGAITPATSDEVGDRIKTGDIAIDFARPISVFGAFLATDLGAAIFTLLPRAVPLLIIGALTTGLSYPKPAGLLLGLGALLLALMLSFCARYAVNILGLWLIETRGIRLLYLIVSGFLMGLFVPVSLFPDWLEWIAHATPFPSMFMTPVNLLSGRVSGAAALAEVGIQLVWLGGLVALGLLLTRAGRAKLEVQGG